MNAPSDAHDWRSTPTLLGEYPTTLWICARCGDWTKSDTPPAKHARRNQGMTCGEVMISKIHEE